MKTDRPSSGFRLAVLIPTLLALPGAAQNLSSVTLSPTSVTGGATSTGTVTLTANAPSGGKVVTLSSSNTGAATVPSSVTVASGTKTKTFTVSTTPQPSNASVVISGVLGTIRKTRTLTVKAPAAASHTVSPGTVAGTLGATGTVTLNGLAPAPGTVVTLSSNNTSAATVPSTVTVLAGATTATYPITTLVVTSRKTVTLSALAGGVTKNSTLYVDPPPVGVASVSFDPPTAVPGSPSTGTVTLSRTPTSTVSVALASSRPADVGVPASVDVSSGQTTGTFAVTTSADAMPGPSTITATLNGTSAQASLDLIAPVIPSLGVDLAEGSLADWQGFAEAPYVATASPESTRVKAGDSSLRFVTDSGFDCGVRYAVPGGAHWDLRNVRFLTFWSFGDNTEAYQGEQPVVILKGPRGSIRLQPADVQTVNGEWRFHRVPLGDPSDWIVTTEGTPSLGDITSFEIHQDTWGMGMTVFYDGVALSSDIPEDLAEGTAALWGTFASDSRPASVDDDATSVRSGTLALSFDTASGFDAGLVFPKSEAGQNHWDLTDVRSVAAWIRAENAESFQGNSPVLVLRSPSGSVRYEPGDVLLNTPGWRYYEIPLDGAYPWTRTQDGNADLADVTGIEIHGDTWGYGFRLQVDGVSVGRPLPMVKLPAASAPAGTTVTAAIHLSELAPAGGRTVLLESSDPAVASVPASVVVPEGERSTTFVITVGAVMEGTPVSIAVTDRGYSARTDFRVDPVVDVTSLELDVVTAFGGQVVPGIVTLAAPAGPDGVSVMLTSSNPTVASVPFGVVIGPGGAMADFEVTTGVVDTSTAVTISASAGAATAEAGLTVVPAPPLELASVSASPAEVIGGDWLRVDCTLTAPAPAGGRTVTLSSSAPELLSVPESVLVPAGALQGGVDASTSPEADGASVTVTASDGPTQKSVVVTVLSPTRIESVDLENAGVFPGEAVNGTVTLTTVAPAGGYAVTLASSSPEVTVPPSLTVPAGSQSVSFAGLVAAAAPGGQVTLSASARGVAAAASLSIVGLSSVVASRTAAGPGQAVTVTVYLSAGVPAGRSFDVALVSSDPAAASVPATVTIPAGQLWATAAATRVEVDVDTPVDFTATAFGTSRTVHVVLEPLKVRSVFQANGRTTIDSCDSDTLTVSLNAPAPAGGIPVDVTITAGSTTDGTAVAGSSPPVRRLIVPAGSSSIHVYVQAAFAAVPATLTLTARLGASEASGSLSVVPGTSTVVALPGSPARGTTLALQLTFANGWGCVRAFSFDAEITSSNPAVLPVTSPTRFDVYESLGFYPTNWRASIPVSAAASAGTTRITVTAQGATSWVDVTVPEASLTGLDLSPSAAPAGAVVLGHVTLDTTASAGGMTVLLSSADPGIAAVPSSIVVAPGTREAVFSLTPQTVTAAAEAVITASVAGQSKTASFRALATDAASFTGTVLDAADWDVEAPLSGANAAISPGVGQFLTGIDGAFHLYAPPGATSVAVSRQGFATTSSTPQSLSPGQAVDLGAIRLKRAVGGACTAVGTVITPQGAPIEGATGILEGYEATYVTNAAGEYTVSLPSHRTRYRMTFSKAGYPTWTEDLAFMGFYPVDCLSVPYLSDLILDPDPRPALSSVSFLQPTVVSGGKVQVRPLLTGPAPPAGAQVSMTLVTRGLSGTSWRALSIPGGQNGSGGSFEVTLPTVEAPMTVTYAFFYGGVTKRTSIEVVPETLSISCPNGLTGATTAACTVSLSTGPAPAGGAVIALTSSYSSLFSVPASATVPQGQTTVTFPLTIGPFFGNYLSATLKGLWAGGWGERSVSAFRPDVDRIDVSPTAVVGGGSATGTVVLMGPAYPTGQTTVALESTLSTITLPATVTVAPGESTATFPIATTPVSQPATGYVSGRLTILSDSTIVGAPLRGGSLLLTPSGLGLACTPAELDGGQEASCQVSLPGSPAPAGGTVVVLTSPSGVLSVPASVTVPQGTSSWGFTVTAIPVVSTTSGVVRASLGTELAEVTLTVRSSSLRSLDLTGGSSPVEGGFRTSASVSLHGTAPAGGILVALSVAGTAAAVPPSVLIPEGNNSASFPVTTVAVSTATDVVLTATYGSVSLTKTLPLEPQTWRLSPLAPGRVVAGAEGVTLYGRDFLPSNTIRLSGPVYSIAAPEVPLCDEPAGACPAVDAADATVIFQFSTESGNRIVFTVPASLSPGYYSVRAKSAAGTLSSEARWILLDDPSPVVPALAPEQHGLARPITSGQAVTGTFVENGDTSGATNDFNLYYFVAAAGTRVSVRLERADTSLPWEHPDSLDPRLALIAPDGFVYENEGRQDVAPSTDLNAEVADLTLPQPGMWLIAASTSRGHGDYRLTYTMMAPGSVPSTQRIVPFTGRGTTAQVGTDVRLTLAAMDPRGYLLSGAGVTYTASYPEPGVGAVVWPEGRGTFTAVDGLAQRVFHTTTRGAVDIGANLTDINGIITASSPDPVAEALVETTLATLPRYQPLEHHPYVVRDVDPDGNLTLDLGPVKTFEPSRPSRPRTEWKTGPGRVKTLGAAPAPDNHEPAPAPRPLPASDSLVAPACTALTAYRHVAVEAPELKTPYTVTLKDVTPMPGKPEGPGLVGEKGIEGNRIEKNVKLELDVRDRDGNPPPHPVLVRLAVGGPRSGLLLIGAEGAQQWCKEAFVVWHEADSQGNPGTHPVAFEYRLGTLSLLPGVEPDPDHPGQVKPVWGVAEVLEATTEAVTPEATLLNQTVFPVRPQPGKPQRLVDWDGPPEDDRWERWNGFYTYFDPDKLARAVWVTSYNAYTLVDIRGNTVWGNRDTRTMHGTSRLTVRLPYQETTGPDFRAYALEVKWWADYSDQMPQGTTSVGLFVSYPASEGEWPAGEVASSVLIDLQGGNQTHLKSYDSYEARFGLDDGAFPMSVSPEAGPEAIPKVGPGPASAPARELDSPRRLALVLLTGREAPSMQEVFRAPHHPWEWTGGTWVEKPVEPARDPRIDVASRPRLTMKLVDVNGNVQTTAGFKVHLCPRFDHEGSPQAQAWPCPTAPVQSTNGVIAELAMNPGVVGNGDPPAPDATGYLGLELTKAPTAPGTYYVYVESLDKDVKVRDQAVLHLDDTPDGQFQGGFALCTVTGAEILDQNFQRVNPITIEAPTRGYVRMILPGSSLSTVQRKIRIEREGGPVITPDTPVTLTRVGASSAYLAPITLKPEQSGASAAAPFAALEPIPELTIALGPNSAVVTNPEGGGVDASCGVDFPALLQLRFLKRDGTGLTDPDPSDPDHISGLKQETAIGGKEEDYAETVKVEIQAVHKDDPAVFCAFCTAEVGIKESPNGSYDTSTRLFYSDGSSGSTKLSSDGRINGQFVKLDGGRKVVELKAVLDVRRDKDSHKPTPTVVTGKAAYEGLGGAKVTAVGTNKRQTKSGPEQYISHWVDEQSYVRKRGQALDPNDVNQHWVPHGSVTDCGGGRDWLEKKIKDCYADWMGDAEVEAGMGRVSAVLDTNDPDSKAVATAGPYERANGHPTTVQMTWTLWHPGVRRPAKAAEIEGYNYDEAGFQVDLAPAGDPAKDNFMQTAIHEARHAWQYTLADVSGRADADDDYMFPEPPASAAVLKDARLGSGNSEYDAIGDLLFDFAAWGDAAYGTPTPIVTAPKEADAIRTSARLVSGQASNLVGCRDSGYALAPVSRVGLELHVLATWKGRAAAAPQPFEGAAVRFDVVSGNMLLSEYVDSFMSRAETWAAPNTGNPGALLRVADASVVSRVRYTDGSNAAADARVLVVPPSSGQATMTRVSATLILPPECAGTTVTRSFDFNP